MRSRITTAGLVLLLVTGPAWPCSIAVEAHVIDENERAVDKAPPGVPEVKLAELKRGRGPRAAGDGSVGVSSCDDIGLIILHVVPPQDDRTPAGKLGYRAEWVSGDLPEDMDLSRTVRLGADTMTLHWIDEARDDQDPIDFTIRVVAVDLAGNAGQPSAPLRIRDDGVLDDAPRQRRAKD